ncbi:hypothetical protein K7X08_016112 [Anisodus acutangulus]|uniref:GIR1-like zinc ribbon domain-containing protein n=1 Tax=Anisodus acutangulus TaxID=402998 RepID=A0A9Q1LD38_9SOLA|nr:hypothetical protein K7X08_016112 [Anisodus acutangulus]
MVAEVSTLVRIMNGSGISDMNESSSSSKSTALITRDLLGGCCTLDSKELDLDLQVPSGWEKRLDLKSGKVYLQRSNSSNYQTVGKFQDFNSPPASKLPLSLFEDTKLELKPILSSPSLPSSSSSSSSSGNYHSVCTLEKVKSALERAEKQSTRKRSSISSSSLMSMASSPTSNPSTSSSKDIIDIDHDDNSSANAFAAGCPSCLLYVLTSRTNPRCPRCNTVVSSPVVGMKKPRIDLNISM